MTKIILQIGKHSRYSPHLVRYISQHLQIWPKFMGKTPTNFPQPIVLKENNY